MRRRRLTELLLCFLLTSFILSPTNVFANEPACVTCARHIELYGAKSKDDLRHFRQIGVDQVILESAGLIPATEQLGMRVVLANWWNADTDEQVIERQLQAARSAKSLVSLNLMDEPIHNNPSIHSPEFYQELRTTLREQGDRTPLSLTIYGPSLKWPDDYDALFKGYVDAVDVLRIDPYPVVAEAPLRLVYDWPRKAQAFIAETGRRIPLTVILQAWSPGDDDQGIPQLPEIDQLRVMAFLAMFSGADTISFFSFDPAVWDRKPGFREGFDGLLKDMRQVQRQFACAPCYVWELPGDVFLIQPRCGRRTGFRIDVPRLRVERVCFRKR
jgi:hypothetical protein